MRKTLAAAAAVLALSCAAWAQVSLWTGKDLASSQRNSVDLAHEVKGQAFQLHDIIAIVVSLSAQASTDEKTDLEKKNDKQNLTIKQYVALTQELSLKGKSAKDLAFDATGAIKSSDTGQAQRQDTLRTRLAAEIVDIKPNGNLVIEARQSFTKQREKTTITLSGAVRPQDVGADNVVFSYNVADADIRYESSGPVTDANKRGWLSKIIDKIWPF